MELTASDTGSARGGRINSEDYLGLILTSSFRFAPQKGSWRIVKAQAGFDCEQKLKQNCEQHKKHLSRNDLTCGAS